MKEEMKEKKVPGPKAPKPKDKKSIVIIMILLIIIFVAATIYVLKMIGNSQEENTNTANVVTIVEIAPEPIKTVQTFTGEDRPIAVMIDNHEDAWPQAALNEAYAVYEIIVEGGETRLMAVFKGKDIAQIGPIRSSRHYFLDYALENDAIYVHYGWSPKAESDIYYLDVNNVNGMIASASSFPRSYDKESPHDVVTTTGTILQIAQNFEYATTSTKKSVLNYVVDEVNLEDGIVANEVYIPYSYLQDVSYTYNEETMRYTRYARGELQTDWVTGEAITTKNIIITFVSNWTLDDGEGKSRQDISNVGVREGYYITNGKAIEITCEKDARTLQTVYRDLEGNEIEVNDGNTFFQICPLNALVTIE